MSAPPEPRPRIRFGLLAGALTAALLTLWLRWPTANWSHDAVAYAALVHRALYTGAVHVLWHPYHMLYMPLGWLVGRLLLAAGVVVDVLGLLQGVNAVLSAAAVMLFAHLARRLTDHTGLALALTAVLGLSFAFWYYATDPEPYPAAILCLLLTLAATLHLLERGGAPAALAAGLAAGLAFGFHAAAGLSMPVVAVATVWLASGPRRRRLLLAAAVVAGFVLTGVLPYVLYYRLGAGVSAASGFVTLAHDVAETRTFGAGPWLLGRGFRPDLELAGILRGVAGAGPGWPGTVARTASAVLIALVLVAAWRLPALWRVSRGVAFVLGGWVIGFLALFSAYNVGSDKFVSFVLVPALLLLGAAGATWPRRGRALAAATWAALGLAVGAANLAAVVIPSSRPADNPFLVRAERIRECTAPGDLVVMLGVGPQALLRIYVPYFSEREVLLLDLAFARGDLAPEARAALVDAELRARLASGHRVLAFGDLIEDPELVAAFERHMGLAPGTLARVLAPFSAVAVTRLDADTRLYELRLPSAPR